MKIQTLIVQPYTFPMTTGQVRSGALLHIGTQEGQKGWGDIAPLPSWSRETLEGCLVELQQKESLIKAVDWTEETCLERIEFLDLFPAVSFALESALLSILSPLSAYKVEASALLMGSKKEILEMAVCRKREGFRSAKIKVSQLTVDDAAEILQELKKDFHLRVDVNRAWSTEASLRFFSQFSVDAFDYVEEPFANPNDLHLFSHPLAVDESFPQELNLKQLEEIPTIKALIYKPTMQGGLSRLIPLYEWLKKRNISLVLSSSFESDVGLSSLAAIARRLSIETPIGIGTYHYQQGFFCSDSFYLSQSMAIGRSSF